MTTNKTQKRSLRWTSSTSLNRWRRSCKASRFRRNFWTRVAVSNSQIGCILSQMAHTLMWKLSMKFSNLLTLWTLMHRCLKTKAKSSPVPLKHTREIVQTCHKFKVWPNVSWISGIDWSLASQRTTIERLKMTMVNPSQYLAMMANIADTRINSMKWGTPQRLWKPSLKLH